MCAQRALRCQLRATSMRRCHGCTPHMPRHTAAAQRRCIIATAPGHPRTISSRYGTSPRHTHTTATSNTTAVLQGCRARQGHGLPWDTLYHGPKEGGATTTRGRAVWWGVRSDKAMLHHRSVSSCPLSRGVLPKAPHVSWVKAVRGRGGLQVGVHWTWYRGTDEHLNTDRGLPNTTHCEGVLAVWHRNSQTTVLRGHRSHRASVILPDFIPTKHNPQRTVAKGSRAQGVQGLCNW
mmetsp:Transcript_1532/g.2769  ORF Transcript_1532/g.2769 Transcript_1532/m.2769 type:complete len:235 (-) Transcript_1532:146-850(-)